MGIVSRQSIKTSIVILAGALIGVAFTYWQTLILPKMEIGISRNLINQGAVFQSLLLFGVQSLAHTYIQRYTETDPKRGAILGTALLVPLIAAICFSIPYFLLQPWIISKYQPQDHAYIRMFFGWLPVLIVLWTYMTLFETYLLARMRVALATFMREVVLRLFSLILLLLVAADLLSFYGFVVCMVLGYTIPVCVMAIVAARETKVKLTLNWQLFTREEKKSIVHYAWYHTLIGAALNIVGFIDQLMLAPLGKDGSSGLAVYSIAVFLIGFVNIPYKAITASAFPRLNQIYQEGDNSYLIVFFNRTNLNILIATAVLGMVIWCNIDNAVAVLPPGYELLAPLFGILLLGRLLDVSTGMNHEFISITPRYKFTFWASLAYIVIAVAGNRIFIPKYGIYGAAWVSTAGLGVFNLIKAVFLKWKFGINPLSAKAFLILPVVICGWVASLLIPEFHNPILDGLIRTPVVLAVMMILLVWLKPSTDINDYLRSIRKNKRLY